MTCWTIAYEFRIDANVVFWAFAGVLAMFVDSAPQVIGVAWMDRCTLENPAGFPVGFPVAKMIYHNGGFATSKG